MTPYIIIAVAAVIIIYGIVAYNRMIQASNKVKEGFGVMDIYLLNRANLVPMLSATVKGYAQHEIKTLEELTLRRSNAVNTADKVEVENEMTACINQAVVVAEKYPELKASENFLALQKQLVEIETNLEHSRRYYNGSVRQYNTLCESFPTNIFAGLLHFQRMPMFEAGEKERKVVSAAI